MEATRETERCLEKIRQGLQQKESQELEQLRQRQAEAEQELEDLQRRREERRRLREEEERRKEELEYQRLAKEEVREREHLLRRSRDGVSPGWRSSWLTAAALAVRRRSTG